MIFAGMLAMGFLLGFCGAGGSGMTIALLVAGFGVPMHEALAVAITAMIFTMISGTISHLREGEVEVKMGLVIGGAGMIGAFIGAHVAHSLPTDELSFFTAMMMFLSAVIMYIRLYHKAWLDRRIHIRTTQPKGRELLVLGSVTGVVGAAGGLGGFAPPLVMGACYDAFGSYGAGLALLAVVAATALAFTATRVRRAAV